MKKEWSEDFRYCRLCYKTAYKHVYDGYCQKCYDDMDTQVIIPEVVRKCLKCEEDFYSKSTANRRCDICIRKEASSSSKPKDRYKVSIKLQ